MVAAVSPAAASGNGAAGKRKWAEVDWEIAMEAMSYVAVFADPTPEEADELGGDEQADAKKKPVSKTKGNAKTKKKAAVAGKKKKAKGTAMTAEVETASKKTTAKEQAKTKANAKKAKTVSKPSARTTRANSKKDDEESEEEKEDDAEKKDAAAKAGGGDATTPQPVEEFWIARLLDDVTQDMLEDEDASVHVTWLNKVAGQAKKDRYVNAFDDTIAVQAILCHVYLVEFDDESMEITPKSLKRVRSHVWMLLFVVVHGRAKGAHTHLCCCHGFEDSTKHRAHQAGRLRKWR